MKELLQQALAALEYHRDQTRPIERSDSAITALREALAAPMPEPVARFINTATQGQKPHWEQVAGEHANDPDVMPLYATPPAAPAPAVPEGDVVVSWNEDGQIVAVTRQDREGRILSVIAESAAPVVREPLTDKQLAKIAVEDEFLLYCDQDSFNEIARAIEQAHGIGGGK